MFPGEHDTAIPHNTKPNSEASLLLSALKCVTRHVPVLDPKTVFDRFPPERVPLSKTHVPWSFHVLAPMSQFTGEARNLGSNTKPTVGCRLPTDASCFPGVFLLVQGSFLGILFIHRLASIVPWDEQGASIPEELAAQFCANTFWHGTASLLKHLSICFNILILPVLLRSCVRSPRHLSPKPQRSLSE